MRSLCVVAGDDGCESATGLNISERSEEQVLVLGEIIVLW